MPLCLSLLLLSAVSSCVAATEAADANENGFLKHLDASSEEVCSIQRTSSIHRDRQGLLPSLRILLLCEISISMLFLVVVLVLVLVLLLLCCVVTIIIATTTKVSSCRCCDEEELEVRELKLKGRRWPYGQANRESLQG